MNKRIKQLIGSLLGIDAIIQTFLIFYSPKWAVSLLCANTLALIIPVVIMLCLLPTNLIGD